MSTFSDDYHLATTCWLPPRGWFCTRTQGHEGPCAAYPKWWAHPIWWFRFGRWRRP